MKKEKLFLNNFVLKIIATISMTFDHIGIFLAAYTNLTTLAFAFRVIGRFSLPIICFLVVEGFNKTKNQRNYLIRLGSAGFLMFIGLTVFQYTPLNNGILSTSNYVDNIFLTLFLGLLTLYFINKPKKQKLLALIPFMYIVWCYVLRVVNNFGGLLEISKIYPLGLLPQYDIYGYLLIVGTYAVTWYYKKTVKQVFEDNNDLYEAYLETEEYRLRYNAVSLIPLILLGTMLIIFNYACPQLITVIYNIQSYALITALFILFYNHKLGFKTKISKYSFYIYYPLHIIIIFLIFFLVFR